VSSHFVVYTVRIQVYSKYKEIFRYPPGSPHQARRVRKTPKRKRTCYVESVGAHSTKLSKTKAKRGIERTRNRTFVVPQIVKVLAHQSFFSKT